MDKSLLKISWQWSKCIGYTFDWFAIVKFCIFKYIYLQFRGGTAQLVSRLPLNLGTSVSNPSGRCTQYMMGRLPTVKVILHQLAWLAKTETFAIVVRYF